MKTASPVYLWWNELAAQMIEGASDSFMIVMGGSAASQLGSAVAVPPVTLRQLGISVAVGAGLYAAAYLKRHPLPSVSVLPEQQINPQPTQPPTNPASQ